MKKILFVFLFSILCMSIYAQDKIFTGNFNVVRMNERPQNPYSQWGAAEDANVNFIIDVDNHKISLSNKQLSVFKIGTKLDTKVINDSEGDETTIFTYEAIDEEEISCIIKLRIWTDYNIVQLYIEYINIHIFFEGKVDNNYKKTD